MNATAPKPAIILGTPINVEESRAQRLQRQQARFRDRGGIFVPTNRSTLLDILLGKASPLKKPRRSASASPSRADEEKSCNEVSKPALRRSPRKQSQKTVDVVTDEQPLAMTDIPESEVSKLIKQASSSKSSRSRPQKKVKIPPKNTAKPRGWPPESPQAFAAVEDSVTNVKGRSTSHRSPTRKVSKGMVDASERNALKSSTKKSVMGADDDREDDVPLVKSDSKGKRVSETKLQGEVDGAKGTSKTRGHKPTTATTSAAVTGSSQLKRTKKVEPVYSELSEDDAACKPTKKSSTRTAKRSAAPLEKVTSKTSSAQKGKRYPNLKHTVPNQLSNISAGEEYNTEKDGPPPSQRVKVSLLQDKLVVARPAKSPNTSDDDGEDDISLIKSKLKSNVTSCQGKPQGDIDGAKCRLKPTKKVESVYSELSEDDSAHQPTKKSSTKELLEDDAACKPTKKSTIKKVKASTAPMETERCESSSSQKGKANETAPCQLPNTAEEDEVCNLGKEDMAPSESLSNAIIASSKGKKRASTSIIQDSDSQSRRKRIKSGTIQPNADLPLHKNSNLSDEVPPLTSKKRRRSPEDVESGVEDGVHKSTKRKKRSGQSESRRAPEIPVEEDGVKPVAKRLSKTNITKPGRKSKNRSSDSAITASKRKENAPMSKPFKVKAASNSGPPKSVLQRIKNSLGAQVVDNEPDPIDFLS